MKRETILTCTIHSRTIHSRGTCEGHLDGINRKVLQTRYIHHLPPQKCSSLIRAGNISNSLALDCTAYHLCNSAILVGRNGSNSGHIKGSPSTNFFLPRVFCRASQAIEPLLDQFAISSQPWSTDLLIHRDILHAALSTEGSIVWTALRAGERSLH